MNRRTCRRTEVAARLLRALVVVALTASSVVVLSVFTAAVALAAPCDAPVTNKVACENTKPGTPDWQVLFRDEEILGFTTDISVLPGGRVDFKMSTSAPSYRIDIYRLGYYGGVGARQMGTVTRNTPQNQPACLREWPSALIDCGNWAVSVSWNVPADAVSGIYYAKAKRNDTGAQTEIVFVVRDDSSHSKIFFQTSDSTWVAYNRFGGNSMYTGDGPGQGGQAYKVSYNRPYTGGDGEENFIFNAEYPMLRFLEANGYDVSYTTDVDSARRGHLIRNHQVFMPVGHDEYWSNEQRDNVEAARDAGVHMAFLTGNEIFWKTRWEPSIDSSAADWRTVVCYKETKASQVDPHPTEWTGTWRDPRYSPPEDGGRPENALLGNIFTVNGRRDDSMQVPAAFGKMRLWRNTPLASMAAGTTYTFQPGTLGYEWNSVEDNGFQPAGVAQLSRTTVTMDGPFILQNYGDLYTGGTKTHALTMYKAPSGALVFGAGTVQWAWGVEDEHAYPTNTPTSDVRMKQATVNLLADMGVQPSTLQAGLVPATASTDLAAPAVAITGTPAGATVGTPYTFSGTVSDAAGRVAGVEVSTDSGATWHLANWAPGTSTWNYTYTPAISGTAGLRARAVDDSANLSTPVAAGPPVAARVCPCGVWTAAATPAVADSGDTTPLELGMKFRANSSGYVRGVKFYKGVGNTGTHTGTLWSTSGQQLGTGTFSGETATGWQTLTFPSPVEVSANTTYIVSYFTPAGHFSYSSDYFRASSTYLEPLTALRSGTDGPNGVFRFGSGFPNQTFSHTNYWVDVVWAPDPGPDLRAPLLVGTSPVDGAGTVALSPVVSATFDEAIAPASVLFTVTGPAGAVGGSSSVSADGRQVSFTPSQPLAATTTYTATLRAADAAGNQLPAPATWSFTTGAPRPATCPCTVWDDFARPALESAEDNGSVEVGTKVRFDGKGEVLGIRFYKGAGNTGTHTGSLWSASGQRLATGTFTAETATGWQRLIFSGPVVVQANTTYVVSYYAPSGRYSVSGGYFAAQSTQYSTIRALANGIDGGNGVYRYGAGGGFPTSSYNATNYWVDVIYRTGLNGDNTAPTLTGRTPAPDATAVGLNSAITATFSEPVDLTSAQIWLADPAGAHLTGSVSLSADQRTVTWDPAGQMSPGTRYTANVRIADVNGNPMTAPVTWAFTTSITPICPCTLFSPATEPTVTSADDFGAYELGVRFTPTSSGRITAVKFYKGAGNTGTHIGSLWSAAGQQLATGTFTNETASGWQTLTFAAPVVVQAGATYVASYSTTTGRYSVNSGYFQGYAVNSGPLGAPATGEGTANGVYRSGAGFPTSSYQGSNYWVDVVYMANADSAAPVITNQTPPPGTTGVSLTSAAVVTFNEAVDLTSAQFSLSDPGGAKLAGTLSISADQRTVTFTPAARMVAGTTYTASVRIADLNGNLMAAPSTWSYTATTSQTCPCTLFSAATAPTVPSAADGGSYELGVRFSTSSNGSITGVKFYKGAGNTATHTGSLWTDAGQLLTTGTFTDETASGWQTLTFASPVPVTAGTTYVASYTTTAGRYSLDSGYFFATAVTSSPLSAPASGAGNSNGVYRVGPGFPTETYGGSNYWVDVVFTG